MKKSSYTAAAVTVLGTGVGLATGVSSDCETHDWERQRTGDIDVWFIYRVCKRCGKREQLESGLQATDDKPADWNDLPWTSWTEDYMKEEG